MLYLKNPITPKLTQILVNQAKNKLHNLHRPEVESQQKALDLQFAKEYYNYLSKHNDLLGITFEEVMIYKGLKHKRAGSITHFDIKENLTILVRLKQEEIEREQRKQLELKWASEDVEEISYEVY